MAIATDCNDNLNVYKSTSAQNKKPEGRAGRVCQSLYKALNVIGEEPPTGEYAMPKEDALPILLETIAWGKLFPIIGNSEAARIQYFQELESLARIRKAASGYFQLTSFGQDVLQHTGDLRCNIVAAIFNRFGLTWRGRIASGYMGAQCDCFLIRPRFRALVDCIRTNLQLPIMPLSCQLQQVMSDWH